jgi:hypothetical protein
MNKVKLTWYGRCCFLIEINGKKFLTDPHDSFDGVDMGQVEADYTLSSSSWHDHGHIGAAPKSIVITEPGVTQIDDITITGISTKETRGTKNVIFNIKSSNFSISNFADLGNLESMQQLSSEDLEIINSTNVAMIRPNPTTLEFDFSCGELALQFCQPKIIIPHHFYPEKFSSRVKAPTGDYLVWVDKMIEKLAYKKQIINGYSMELDLDDYSEKTALLFDDIHPQVIYNG